MTKFDLSNYSIIEEETYYSISYVKNAKYQQHGLYFELSPQPVPSQSCLLLPSGPQEAPTFKAEVRWEIS